MPLLKRLEGMDVGVQSRKGVAALLSMKLRILEDAASRGCDFVCLEEP